MINSLQKQHFQSGENEKRVAHILNTHVQRGCEIKSTDLAPLPAV